jgi:NTP pyrophosphatase (non-canonical NTP hydrolase)
MTRTEHLLTILAEECAEVAQRVSKSLRFGLAEVQPGQLLTNAERIEAELTDLLAAVGMLIEERIIADPTVNDLAMRMKKAKVEKFLKFSAGRGLVDDSPDAPTVPHPEAGGP